MSTLKNIVSDGEKMHPDGHDEFFLPFIRNEADLSNEGIRTTFVKSVERLVRTSDEYSGYKAFLMREIPGMNRCALHADITIEKAKIDMHHGPIFTMYDYAEILVIWFIRHSPERLCSLSVADQLIEEHLKDHVQVVMLSQMVHKAVHAVSQDRGPFIPVESAYGDIVGFIREYRDSVTVHHANKVNRYILRYEREHQKSGKESSDMVFVENVKSFKDAINNLR